VLLLALAWAGVQPWPAHAQSTPRDSLMLYEQRIGEQEKQLETLRTEIRKLRRRDHELKNEEVGTLEQLKILDQEVGLTTDLLRELETKQKRLEAQLEGIVAEHARAQEILDERRDRLARTLRAMYVRGSEIRQQEIYLAHTSAQLTENLSEVAATTSETQSERRRLEESRSVRKSTLERVRQQRGEHQKMITDLAASEQQLQRMIATLEHRRQEIVASGDAFEFADLDFIRLRGRMRWPVRGEVENPFGRRTHPQHSTVTFNSGIDIAAREGELVQSVGGGRVEYVSWLDGYGRTIIVNHGSGYYTVYAHLSEILVVEKQRVAPGDVIARVGDTGSLDGPKLHFEVRQKAEALDPMLWLLQ
jgi:murein DD-endopeptidase MepM/ murein hydrolase activator NlpD